MPGEKSEKSKKKGGDDKSQKSKSKSKEKESKAQKSATKGDKKQKSVKESKAKKQTSKKQAADEQSQLSAILPQTSDCVHHKSPFIYFCETCQELVCNQCTVYGPHNNHLHRILKITDAYRSRVFYLSEAIRSNLVDKRDKIIAQLHRLEYRIQEIRFVKGIIQRDIRSEYSGILERLKSFEGIKLAKVSHQVSLTQRQIDAINDLGNQFFTLTSMDCDQVQQQRKVCKFLSKSKQMYEAIQYIINKPQRDLPNLQIDQIPREIQINREDLQKALAAKELNNFKNELIWNLNCQLTNQQNYVKDQIEQKADMVIKNLCNDVQNLSLKLNNYKMVCHYCGVPSTPEAVRHNICEKNVHGVDSLKIPTQKTPDEKYTFNGRHFFSYEVKNKN